MIDELYNEVVEDPPVVEEIFGSEVEAPNIKNISIPDITGSFKDGMVLAEDILAHVSSKSLAPAPGRKYDEVDDIKQFENPLVDVEIVGFEAEQVTTAPELEVAEAPGFKKVKVLASLAVRRIALEYGVRLADITGSGKEGRVLKKDILTHEKIKIPLAVPEV